ncbi:hypothetical protein ACIBJF_06420 [Streptomyces sp. NPDC050743]|uniref:hypothetical protein n=1 Tax=Streptomyces sp. NPDC050743 TaxID=3365634 RepID=UPI0037957280
MSHWLTDGASLRQHPSRPFWYDTNGTHQVQHRTHTRPTGKVSNLLVAEDWLLERLSALGTGLVQGIVGEGQPVTTEPRTWQELSQAAGVRTNTRTVITPRISTVRNNYH